MNNSFDLMNELGAAGIPFLFVADFSGSEVRVERLDSIRRASLLYQFPGRTNNPKADSVQKKLQFTFEPVDRHRFGEAFQKVQHHLRRGDSFLLNLTMPSRVEANMSLKEIFNVSEAPYKLWINDQLVVFSPETFVTIRDNVIRSNPMKGTIDADLPDAEQVLLSSHKELAEHYTIVDLIRNDLSMVATKVRVERFRYLTSITTHRHRLLQMSSEIAGDLHAQWPSEIGSIIQALLPAGSISGAPKKKTVEIINEVEGYRRGFYTGVMGLFDGSTLDSAVMIRFIEQTPDGLVYKSGGGITSRSVEEEEYHELINKIYVPLA